MLETHETLARFWEELLSRPSGPMSFRFVLQPTMAALFAIRVISGGWAARAICGGWGSRPRSEKLLPFLDEPPSLV